MSSNKASVGSENEREGKLKNENEKALHDVQISFDTTNVTHVKSFTTTVILVDITLWQK